MATYRTQFTTAAGANRYLRRMGFRSLGDIWINHTTGVTAQCYLTGLDLWNGLTKARCVRYRNEGTGKREGMA